MQAEQETTTGAETYGEMRRRQQAEVNAMPIKWAFNQEQFREAMEALGAVEPYGESVARVQGGGFVLKSDIPQMVETFERHDRERREARQWRGFAVEMFVYELANHEYSYTQDEADTLDALGLTRAEVDADPVLSYALQKAKRQGAANGCRLCGEPVDFDWAGDGLCTECSAMAEEDGEE